MCYNLLQSFIYFDAHTVLEQASGGPSAGRPVLLPCPLRSMGMSLFSGPAGRSRLIVSVPPSPWNWLFLQGALDPSGGERHLAAKTWAPSALTATRVSRLPAFSVALGEQ